MAKTIDVKTSDSTALTTITPEQLAAEAQAMIAQAGAGASDIVRVKNKQFILPDGREVPDGLAGIILDFVHVNEFYEGRYDPKKIVPPSCAAKSTDPNNMIPYDSAPKRQAESCVTCPNNQFGSDGKGKACKNSVWLSVLEPTEDLDGSPVIIKLAPTAVTPFKRYLSSLASLGRPHFSVITHFTLDKSVDYAKILCESPTPLTGEQIAKVMARRADAVRRLTQPTNFEVAA